MNISLLLLLIGLVLVFFLALKLFKNVIKALILVVILSIVLLGVFGLIVYFDVKNLSQGFQGEKTIIIMHQDLVITAFNIKKNVSVPDVLKKEFYESLSEKQFSDLKNKIELNQHQKIDSEGLIFLIDQSVFKNLKISINNQELLVNESFLEEFSAINNEEEALVYLQSKNINLNNQLSIMEIRNEIYYALLIVKLKENKLEVLIAEIKNGNVNTIPALTSINVMNFFQKK